MHLTCGSPWFVCQLAAPRRLCPPACRAASRRQSQATTPLPSTTKRWGACRPGCCQIWHGLGCKQRAWHAGSCADDLTRLARVAGALLLRDWHPSWVSGPSSFSLCPHWDAPSKPAVPMVVPPPQPPNYVASIEALPASWLYCVPFALVCPRSRRYRGTATRSTGA